MEKNIESHLIEKRVFKPARKFAKKARISSLEKYRKMYRKSIRNPDKFWARQAEELVWQTVYSRFWRTNFKSWLNCSTTRACSNWPT